ncbi:hypothetical protein [Virgibacillus ndiopensis]|uniref:hypothetical protein n=1 Tax=Virgibacillus ndiopensis TaxID=2004408 RepID=UPI00159B91FE|nr:hypothetical protein [Virgibacillus ndiopensis]
MSKEIGKNSSKKKSRSDNFDKVNTATDVGYFGCLGCGSIGALFLTVLMIITFSMN